MSSCAMLVDMKKRIEAGENPEEVIPYSIDCVNKDDAREILYFASQVLPDGRRKETVKNILKELEYESR